MSHHNKSPAKILRDVRRITRFLENKQISQEASPSFPISSSSAAKSSSPTLSSNKADIEKDKTVVEIEHEFECAYCDYGTNIYTDFLEHINTNHLEMYVEREFECGYSDFGSDLYSSFWEHINNNHLEMYDDT